MRGRMVRVLGAFGVGLVLAGGIVWWQVDAMERARQESATAALGDFSGVDVGGGFSLTNHRGERVTNADFEADFLFIYFGFVFCPDVCPTELAEMAQTLDVLGDEAAQVQPVFVTIDPERDTPEAMADYVSLFHPRLVGLTGSTDDIATVADAYKVYYQRVDSAEYTYYLMDHSSFLYFTDRSGDLLYLFAPQHTPDEMADIIRIFMDREMS